MKKKRFLKRKGMEWKKETKKPSITHQKREKQPKKKCQDKTHEMMM